MVTADIEASVGRHNQHLGASRDRLLRGKTYRDCSTVMIVPAIADIPPRVVQSWMALMVPMNQHFTRIFIENCEVGDAYNQAIQLILDNDELRKWKYILTVETDNMPPPDGLLKLIEDIEGEPKYDAVGGLYWTKGEGGQPMCYGQPQVMPRNFLPWLPDADTVSQCNGLGMGFTLFRLEIFRKMPPPWFKTVQQWKSGEGAQAFTQDLKFAEDAAKYGFRFACSTRVLVGHFDKGMQVVW